MMRKASIYDKIRQLQGLGVVQIPRNEMQRLFKVKSHGEKVKLGKFLKQRMGITGTGYWGNYVLMESWELRADDINIYTS